MFWWLGMQVKCLQHNQHCSSMAAEWVHALDAATARGMCGTRLAARWAAWSPWNQAGRGSIGPRRNVDPSCDLGSLIICPCAA